MYVSDEGPGRTEWMPQSRISLGYSLVQYLTDLDLPVALAVVRPTGLYLLDVFCSGIQFNVQSLSFLYLLLIS